MNRKGERSNAFQYLSREIDTRAKSVEIHKARSHTLATRVKSIIDAIPYSDKNINLNEITFKASSAMILATLEEISDYFETLQRKDEKLGRRVMRYGCDEESFCKWNETLQTCSVDLKLSVADNLFDADKDLADFNQDYQDLQKILTDILEKVPGISGTIEAAVKARVKVA